MLLTTILPPGARRGGGAAGGRGLLFAFLVSLLLCFPPAWAQSGCFVADTELQVSYDGACRDGKAEGRAKAKGSAEYVGEFHQGNKEGFGVKTWPWGDRYEGEFHDDAKHGYGRYTWGKRSAFAGDRYEGGFANDMRNGYGVYVWASGDAYAGPWKDDAVSGRATPMMIARFRAVNASLAAMKPGMKVCREADLGVGSTQWAEGEVRAVDPGTRLVEVRLTQPGPVAVVVAGKRVAVGEVVWDDPLNWIPCR